MRYNRNIMKNKTDTIDSIEQETVRDCPLLYKMRNRPCSETCMCWGWEFEGNGWDDAVRDMSYELETLNAMFYPKYRTRIQMDQIKSKFGYFTAYHSVVVDHGSILTYVMDTLKSLSMKCLDRDFKPRNVVDVEPFDYDDTEEIAEEEFKNVKNIVKCSNVDYVKRDGKFLKITHLRNYGKRHLEPTVNRLWWKLGHILETISNRLDCMWTRKDGPDIRRVVNFMDNRAFEIIRKTEKRCEELCERCGTHIGSDWSPVCETTGWISFLCDKCAASGNLIYRNNGKLYRGSVEVKAKNRRTKGK